MLHVIWCGMTFWQSRVVNLSGNQRVRTTMQRCPPARPQILQSSINCTPLFAKTVFRMGRPTEVVLAIFRRKATGGGLDPPLVYSMTS